MLLKLINHIQTPELDLRRIKVARRQRGEVVALIAQRQKMPRWKDSFNICERVKGTILMEVSDRYIEADRCFDPVRVFETTLP